MTGQHNQAVDQDGNDLNSLIRYTMWSVFKVEALDGIDRAAAAEELAALLDKAAEQGVTTRGSYDVQGFRADADIMFWWVADSSEQVQDIYTAFRRTRIGRVSTPVWSVVGLHRPAEFNRGHVPAFMAGEEPREHLCVYPFVRSYEWYLLPDDERRAMLAEHGRMAAPYPDVRANTVSSFGLNDYEWLLAFEADDLHRIVDLMRHLRGAKARLHTREEVPFYTGRRKSVAELVESLP
ncbi:hydrogen peroxide-dependent heme synthase [Nocardiopsis sp. RV163]|uniref:hydrogen peroxide-dependent heme synthase n=1 Tax=Nocardiopsis sp. RV163 TaxID=1661388 RepID=UPI00064BE814|nr:hydrogen peroxide-dependent heme synthase [Nocardiopsis sp. RV163]